MKFQGIFYRQFLKTRYLEDRAELSIDRLSQSFTKLNQNDYFVCICPEVQKSVLGRELTPQENYIDAHVIGFTQSFVFDNMREIAEQKEKKEKEKRFSQAPQKTKNRLLIYLYCLKYDFDELAIKYLKWMLGQGLDCDIIPEHFHELSRKQLKNLLIMKGVNFEQLGVH